MMATLAIEQRRMHFPVSREVARNIAAYEFIFGLALCKLISSLLISLARMVKSTTICTFYKQDPMSCMVFGFLENYYNRHRFKTRNYN
jgi:hypothetical protein